MELLYKFCFGLTAISGIVQGVFVLYKNPQSRVNVTWALTSVAVAIWSVALVDYAFNQSYEKALFVARIGDYAAAFIPVFFSHFCLALLNRPLRKHPLVVVGYVFVAILGIFFLTPVFIPSVSPKSNFRYFVNPGPLFVVFTIHFFSLVCYSYALIFRFFNQQSPKRKEQIRYVAVATIAGYVCGSTTFLLAYNIPFNPWPSLFTFIYAGITTYAIVKHQLMDIKVAVTRTGTFLATYLVVLGVPFAMGGWGRAWLEQQIGPQWWLVPLGLCTVLATIGPFVYAYLRRQAEARLLKDQRQYQRLLQHAARGMTQVKTLGRLTKLIVHVVSRTVRVTHASLFLFEPSNEGCRLISSHGPKKLAIQSRYELPQKHPLVGWLLTHQRVLSRDQQDLERAVGQEMGALNANLIIPGFIENQLIGFLVLGDKLSGAAYSLDDLHAFSILANEAAIAIDNARSYEELAKVNEQLQSTYERVLQQERLAAAGQFAAGMAHEIKNPLSSIKIFAEYLPDKYSDPVFREKFFRVVPAEIDRINSIVGELSDFAKPAPPHLQPVRVAEVIEDTLSLLSNQFLNKGVKIVTAFLENGLQIHADPQQLKQVFLNLFLNSLDAMPSGGKLEILSQLKDKHLVVVVKDTGAGIPSEHVAKLFDPFFTTKERGMGLGLAIVKGIVERHGGTISISSQPHAGTTVRIELPQPEYNLYNMKNNIDRKTCR